MSLFENACLSQSLSSGQIVPTFNDTDSISRYYLMREAQMQQLQKDHNETIKKIENNKINDLTDEKLLLLIED